MQAVFSKDFKLKGTVKTMRSIDKGPSVNFAKKRNVVPSVSSKTEKRTKGGSNHKQLKVHRNTVPVLALDKFWTRCIMNMLHGTGWRKLEWQPIARLFLREFVLCGFVLWFIVSLGQEIQHDRLLLDRFGNPELLPDRLAQFYFMYNNRQRDKSPVL